MISNHKHVAFIALLFLVVIGSALLPLTGCANRGIGPQGGPVDTIPPQIVKMTIPDGALNVQAKQMSIQFDEYIQINGSTDNILVSPPQQRPPEIKAVGKKIDIEFQEDLKDSTTYTIDFGDQIVDNNERNPLKNFSVSFSTGDRIDSLEVYGQLINAEDLNPISGIVIGLHREGEDTSFYSKPFVRIARTNAEGEFAIKNVQAGTYHLYALQDQSRDYYFQPGEGLAFMDQTITPYITTEVFQDTIYLKDTLDAAGLPIADSVITSEYVYFEPSDIVLRFFKEDYQRLYLQRMIRNDAHLIQIYFNGPQPAMPQFQALRMEQDSLGTDSLWVDFTKHSLVLHNASMDTFNIWLTDSAAIRMDTIRLAMTYGKSDSTYAVQPQTDTLMAVYHAPRLTERARKALAQKREKAGLTLRSNGSRSFNYFDTLLITSPTPIAFYEKDSIHLLVRKDTLWLPVPCKVEKKPNRETALAVIAKWQLNSDYQLCIDSGAVVDAYALANKKDKFEFHVRSMEEYATIKVFLTPYVENAVLQILDMNDKPIRTLKAEPNGTVFQHMEGGTFFMRMFIDDNGDQKWTTGDLQLRRQPEQVYYFHKKMVLRANWEFEEHFDWQVVPVLQQKPASIRKDLGVQKK